MNRRCLTQAAYTAYAGRCYPHSRITHVSDIGLISHAQTCCASGNWYLYCIALHNVGSPDVYIPGLSAPNLKTLVLSCLPTPLIALQASKPTTLPGEYARAFPVELLPAVRASPHRVQQVMSPGRRCRNCTARCVLRSTRS